MAIKFNLSSKLALAALLGLAVFLGYLRYQQYKNQVAINQERNSLQSQIASLGDKNQNLSQSLSYLGTSDFKERVARQQLNLKRDGEVVFGFTDAPQQTPAGASQAASGAPNYEKWIEYFFGSN